MKRFMPVVVATVACTVLGSGMIQAAEQQAKVENYSYGAKLDIAKVISIEDPAKVCEAVPVHMVYEDHQGQRHTLEFRVMGSGCTNN